jgi:hypothetical protein
MQDRGKKSLEEIRKEMKELLVVNLELEDITPEEIKDDEPLFEEGIGLDSLDAELWTGYRRRRTGKGDLSVDRYAVAMGIRESERVITLPM